MTRLVLLICLLPAAALADLRQAAEKTFYPLKECPVSANPLDGKMGPAIDLWKKGRLVRVCCKNCTEEIDDNLERIQGRIDRAWIAAQRKDYPLQTCPISGKKLGEMGPPIERLAGVRLVRLCCKGCVKKFEADPAAALKKVDQALIEAQRKAYPHKTCPVSGNKLGSMGEPHDLLFHTQLVRLCCKGCVEKFTADPAGMLKKLAAAPAKQGPMLAVLQVEGMT